MLTIRTISNIFDLTGRVTTQAEIRPGTHVIDYIPERFQIYKEKNLRIIHNGKNINLESAFKIIPKDNDELIFTLEPKGGAVAAAVWWAIKWVAIQYATSKVIDWLVGSPDIESKPDYSSEGVYGWGGIKNTARNGQIIPVVYGEHKVGGEIIKTFNKEIETNNNELSMQIALSEGEIDSIAALTGEQDDLTAGAIPTDIKINNNAASSYTGVKVSTRLGTNTQTQMAGFRESSSNVPENLDVTYAGGAITITTAGSITGYELRFLFPYGLRVRYPWLWRGNNKGPSGMQPYAVSFSIRHKISGGAWSAPVTHTVNNYSIGYLFNTYRKDGLTSGIYEIEITRTTKDDAALLIDHPEFTGAWTSSKLYDMNELVSDDLKYPNTALLGVKAMATDQLSGGTPTITAIIKGKKVDVWNEDSPPTFTNVWTDNPAWCLLDVLLNDRYGLGDYITVDDIDLDSFQDWADYCDDLVKDGTPGQDFTVSIATPAVISITAHGLSIGDSFKVETTGALPTGMAIDTDYFIIATGFGANSFQFSITLGGSAVNTSGSQSGVHTLFTTHKRCTLNMVFDGTKKAWDAVNQICSTGRAVLIKTGKKIKVKFEAAGSPVQLFTMGNIIKDSFKINYLSKQDRPNFLELQFLNEDNDYEQDVISLEDPAAYAEGEDYRKETGSLYGITRSAQAYREALFRLNVNRYLTRTISFIAGIDSIACEVGDIINFAHDVPQWGYSGRVISATNSTVTLDREVTIVSGTYKIRVRKEDDTEEEVEVTDGAGTYTTLNISGTWTGNPDKDDLFSFGLENILVKPFRITEITSVNDLTRKITCVEYNADIYDDDFGDIEELTYSALPDPSQFPDDVTDLTLEEMPFFMQDGSINYGIGVSFNLPLARVTQADIWLKYPDADYWLYIGSTKTGHFVIDKNLRVGQIYTVAVTSVSVYNTRKDPASAPYETITISGQAGLPDDVTNLNLVQIGDGIFLTWDAVTNINLAGYEIRVGSSWNTGIVIGTNIKENRYSTTNFAPGLQTFMIKAIDTTGNYSANAETYTVDLDPRINDNVILTQDEQAIGFTGTKDDMTVNADDYLELDAGELDGYYISTVMDVGAIRNSRIYVEYDAYQKDKLTTWADAVYAWNSAWAAARSLAGSVADEEVTVGIQIRTSDDNVTWSDWMDFVVGEYQFRYLQVRINVTVSSTDYGYVITALKTTIDVPDVFDSEKNVTIDSAGTAINYSKTFLIIPAITTGIQDGEDGDTVKFLDKTITGFTAQIINSGGVPKNGTIDWVARGF